MNEILLFESSGSMEYFPDPETIEEDKTYESIEEAPSGKVEEDTMQHLEEDPEELMEEDSKEQLEEDPEEQIEEDTEEVIEENKEEGKKNDVFQVSDVQNEIYSSDETKKTSGRYLEKSIRKLRLSRNQNTLI